MSFYNKLNNVLSSDDKKYLIYLFLFTILIAMIETLGVSIIMPFLSVTGDFSLVETNEYYKYVYDFLGFSDVKNFVIIFGVIILIFYFIRAGLNSLYVFLIMHFINSRYSIIVNKLFKKYLSLPYKDYIEKNTSFLTKSIVNEAANITELFWFALILLSEVLVFIFIYSVLMYINYQITMVISLVILVVGFIIKVGISRNMKYYGEKREEYQKDFYEVLNKSFNNVKMLKLQSRDNNINEFDAISEKYVKTKIISGTLQQLPRFLFEFVGFGLVVLIVLYHLINTEVADKDLLALVSVFILGLYRILPSITRIFLSYNTILFQYRSLDVIHNDLNLPVENLENEKISFKDEIRLDTITFSYGQREIIKKLNLNIKKEDKIAFIGESGSGKSTLVDIIMGLHKVSDGEIYIDNDRLSEKNLNNWRSHFGYIPQTVYLFDGTIAENVAFGLDIDIEKVIGALSKANIWEFLKDKDGLETKVGESGVMLSGGQKQRIAIARALYKNPDILVLDEATSALDDETEAKIMDEIYEVSKDKTLIIIAHRLSTIRRCDKVYKIENGEIKNV